MELHISQRSFHADKDAMQLVLYLCGLRSIALVDIAYWLCSKADSDGVVVPIAHEYRTELVISTQNFHNYLGMLREKNLLEGNGGYYTLAPVLYSCYKQKECNINIKITQV